ncbi:hypothetical protein C2G38_2234962 [Gigaspora rosea]|uniref:DUF659 domain-containing protein n=1 Tax=Gigaspora rosea TaxID=44941 RepID=A0A397TU95_9GLOM|nr:hypothetical protein C2G38_2234962 [Gigaspora rosea]
MVPRAPIATTPTVKYHIPGRREVLVRVINKGKKKKLTTKKRTKPYLTAIAKRTPIATTPAAKSHLEKKKLNEETVVPHKRTNDYIDNGKEDSPDSSTEQSTHDVAHDDDNNPYFQDFLNDLNSSYNSPSRDMIKEPVLTEMFSNHILNKLETLSTLTDLTISLDGWTVNSGNSIYGFMLLKKNQETVLDILDLFAYRHTGEFLKDKVKEVLFTNDGGEITFLNENFLLKLLKLFDVKIGEIGEINFLQ